MKGSSWECSIALMTDSTNRNGAPWWRRVEAPTWAMAFAVYVGFGLITWYYEALPWWSILPFGAWFVCWQGSLQHEILHGHPTRVPAINSLLAYPSLWLWLPYPVYRESHLQHHTDDDLALPGIDPESYYVSPAAWAEMPSWRRFLLRARNSLAGRLILGPAMAYVELFQVETQRFRRGDHSHGIHWLVHIPVVAGVLYWAVVVCGIPFWVYVSCFAYPGLSLTMLRSFAEHRPAQNPAARIVVVETWLPMRLLYFNNNYHAPHHAEPGKAWYELHDWYWANRDGFLQANEGYVFGGYGEQVRRFLFAPKDSPVHP